MDEPLEFTDSEEQEYYEHFRLTVDKGQGLLRIDKFLMSRIENASRNKIQNAAKAGNILVNDKPVKQNYRVKPCDVISIVMAQPLREIELLPENIPLNIVYEDEHLVVVNKESGMVVHPGYGNYTGTMVNALMYHFSEVSAMKTSGDVRPGLVHRIDKNTSGILLVAKNEIVQTRLAKMFFDKTIKRVYYALVWGDFEQDEGTITGHIGRSLKDRKIMHVFADGSYGKHAVTHYKVLERFGYVTLVECRLETGRTHQIRAHFRYIGHPVFNDDTYGGDQILKGTTFTKYKQFINNCFDICPRHCLHAKSLEFEHPVTRKHLFFDSPLPKDMATLIDKWRHYSKHKELE
ncbi:MAG: Ribosomal large subunit pseudouridine synthase D [Bacteroidetes bacterium ADurb.Bin408]|nr:MAG: Ribosomal large subunit pseudouridine synthase D [Bacteroidetes bacterium ADurb.Bin408]